MSLDSRLRDILHDNRFELPGWEDPVARVGRGIRRRRRNRLVLTCAAAALLLAVPAVLWPRPTPGVDAPIAFTDHDSTLAAPAYLARRSPRPDSKPCAAMTDRPWLKRNPTEGSAATTTTTVMLPSASSERCTLADGGATTLTVTNKTTGLREVFTPGNATPLGAWQSPATIDPGEPARLDITASQGCGQSFDDFILVLLDRRYDLDLTTDCPPTLTGWYVEPPLLNAPLTVAMKAPATVQRGQWFEYIVTVLSAQGTFKLLDCPIYLQRLGRHAEWRRLNCNRLKAFPAHTPISFTMRAYVPPDQPTGSTELSWMAVMSDGKVAIANFATEGLHVDVA